ncbi:MAG: NAD(P)/FAD-dependent oxidoreductase [Sandaracinaceae bacterium]|nr:NAD(P)/FAD-dependent oxidoreductase [Sandaracinaceae bacterium]
MAKRDDRPHVVILGGGFGGLAAARALRRAPVRVTLVDRQNHHLFQPLLYQVATSALSAPDIAAPLRKLLRRQQNARVLMADALDLDPDARTVTLDDGELRYDYLVLATGMKNNYFGHDEWEEHAPGLKTLREALDIRARVLRAYEAAERETDRAHQRELLTFVVIGAGPTGVEMAGALAEIAHRTLARDFDGFDPVKDARVVLVEGGPRVLPSFTEESSRAARAELEELGVEVRTGTRVGSVDAYGVTLGDAERIEAGTVVWAAGLKASSLTAKLGCPLDRAGRVEVAPDCTVPGRPEVFVLGDLLALEQDGKPLPGVAQTALQSGAFAAEQIENDVLGYPRRARFVYRDKGSMATIGRARAVAEVGSASFGGFLAWMLWVFIHLVFLVDFRNRVAVLLEWAYAYVSWQRSARVIVDAPQRRRPRRERARILASALEARDAPSDQQPG